MVLCMYICVCVCVGASSHSLRQSFLYLQKAHKFIYLDIYSPPCAIRTLNPKREIDNALFSICSVFSVLYSIHTIS